MKKKCAFLITVMFVVSLFVAANSIYAVGVSKVNINTATVEQLQELPGVGPVTAQRIVAFRDKTPFSTPEQLLEIKGIGQKTFAKMKGLVTVD